MHIRDLLIIHADQSPCSYVAQLGVAHNLTPIAHGDPASLPQDAWLHAPRWLPTIEAAIAHHDPSLALIASLDQLTDPNMSLHATPARAILLASPDHHARARALFDAFPDRDLLILLHPPLWSAQDPPTGADPDDPETWPPEHIMMRVERAAMCALRCALEPRPRALLDAHAIASIGDAMMLQS
jgi:hypothetical protein